MLTLEHVRSVQVSTKPETVDPFARPSGTVVFQRKGDDGGGWGGDSWGGGGGGKGGKRGGGAVQGTQREKVLKPGSYGEAAGRTYGVLEVGLGSR